MTNESAPSGPSADSLAGPRARGRLIAVIVPPALGRLAPCGVIAPPTIWHSTWTALLDGKPLLLNSSGTGRLASRTLILCLKLRIVENFSSRSVNVFNVASDDFDLGVGWCRQANCSRSYDRSQHNLSSRISEILIPHEVGWATSSGPHRTVCDDGSILWPGSSAPDRA